MFGMHAVWQHKGASNQWHDFPEDVNAAVDCAFQQGKPGAHFSIQERHYTIKFDEGKQYPDDEPASARIVRRCLAANTDNSAGNGDSAASGGGERPRPRAQPARPSTRTRAGAAEVAAVWQFEAKGGSWRDFPAEVSVAVEQGYKASSATTRYSVRGEAYELDFRAMKQRSVRDPTRTRAVRRVGGPGGSALVPESITAIWHRLAAMDEDVSTEEKVLQFFARRQGGAPSLSVAKCTRVENARIRAFKPEEGHHPTLVFHGTPEALVGNIMAEGLLMQFCGGCGGIFGAMNPQTSLNYAKKAGGARHFMFVCLYDLAAPPQPGAAYSVPKDTAATVLWLLKLA